MIVRIAFHVAIKNKILTHEYLRIEFKTSGVGICHEHCIGAVWPYRF